MPIDDSLLPGTIRGTCILGIWLQNILLCQGQLTSSSRARGLKAMKMGGDLARCALKEKKKKATPGACPGILLTCSTLDNVVCGIDTFNTRNPTHYTPAANHFDLCAAAHLLCNCTTPHCFSLPHSLLPQCSKGECVLLDNGMCRCCLFRCLQWAQGIYKIGPGSEARRSTCWGAHLSVCALPPFA